MKRLTTETPKDNLETALNLFYIGDLRAQTGCGARINGKESGGAVF